MSVDTDPQAAVQPLPENVVNRFLGRRYIWRRFVGIALNMRIDGTFSINYRRDSGLNPSFLYEFFKAFMPEISMAYTTEDDQYRCILHKTRGPEPVAEVDKE